jgi:hypothetical protein
VTDTSKSNIEWVRMFWREVLRQSMEEVNGTGTFDL